MRPLYTIAFLYMGISAFALVVGSPPISYDTQFDRRVTYTGTAEQWFRYMRTYCNPDEIDPHLYRSRPPAEADSPGYLAACYTLAGRIDDARRVIKRLSGEARMRAAGAVFDAIYPSIDRGYDRGIAPIMELVIEFWPNHGMALYHAGMARKAFGDVDLARNHLEAFVNHYPGRDELSMNARAALRELAGR